MVHLPVMMLDILTAAAQNLEQAAVANIRPHDRGYVSIRVRRVDCALVAAVVRELIQLEKDLDVTPTP